VADVDVVARGSALGGAEASGASSIDAVDALLVARAVSLGVWP
jgi:hypothetical protein